MQGERQNMALAACARRLFSCCHPREHVLDRLLTLQKPDGSWVSIRRACRTNFEESAAGRVIYLLPRGRRSSSPRAHRQAARDRRRAWSSTRSPSSACRRVHRDRRCRLASCRLCRRAPCRRKASCRRNNPYLAGLAASSPGRSERRHLPAESRAPPAGSWVPLCRYLHLDTRVLYVYRLSI